jgi:hypothetical protein
MSEIRVYYTASGYPPGRWLGGGLTGLGQAAEPARGIQAPTRVDPPPRAVKESGVDRASEPGLTARPQPPTEAGALAAGDVVTEEQMVHLYGRGEDPVTGDRLGARYRVYRPVDQRVADRVAHLPEDLPADERAAAVADIRAQERRRGTPSAVAGFDLTFTMAKSASVLWGWPRPRCRPGSSPRTGPPSPTSWVCSSGTRCSPGPGTAASPKSAPAARSRPVSIIGTPARATSSSTRTSSPAPSEPAPLAWGLPTRHLLNQHRWVTAPEPLGDPTGMAAGGGWH